MWEGPPPWLSQRTTQREREGARREGEWTRGASERAAGSGRARAQSELQGEWADQERAPAGRAESAQSEPTPPRTAVAPTVAVLQPSPTLSVRLRPTHRAKYRHSDPQPEVGQKVGIQVLSHACDACKPVCIGFLY
jgi:hypothetical protein